MKNGTNSGVSDRNEKRGEDPVHDSKAERAAWWSMLNGTAHVCWRALLEKLLLLH